ncbi:MAG: hypothetical protein JWM23_534 [Microbacteriaceae bacterium]|nr:hypothetical protein [Microbacteriaceae bacterium]
MEKRLGKWGVVAVAAILAVGGTTAAFAVNGHQETPAAVVQTVEPSATPQPYVNGLAGEQEAEAAAAKAAEAQAVADAAAAQAAADAAAAQATADAQAAAQAQATEDSAAQPEDAPEPVANAGLPSGAVPPNVAGSDQPDSTSCASSTLTWDGSQSVCA